MRKMNYVLLIILLFSPMTWGQEKVEAPVWNVGDKWIFTKGSIEVVDADAKSYVLIYSSDFPTIEQSGIERKIVFDRSTLNRIYAIHKGKTEKYTEDFRKMFNFPLYPKKEWQDNYFSNTAATEFIEYYEVLGWQDVEVEAGTFKTIKIERISKPFRAHLLWGQRAIFWYAPEVKNLVKCRFNLGNRGTEEWELVSFKLKR